MRKLVKGIVEFRQNKPAGWNEKFAKLALGQYPDSLFIACSDSRVAANAFASTNPGDLFVIRNVGNLIPCCGTDGHSSADESEAAAIEYAVNTLKVCDIIVCGHSECGAMKALIEGRDKITSPNLKSWLRHGEESLLNLGPEVVGLSRTNQLSQANVLQQLQNLKSYPIVKERLDAGTLQLHGWWFELQTSNVYAYEDKLGKFVVIDENEADRILARLDTSSCKPHSQSAELQL